MLLDLLPHTPECIVELIGWEPLSYEEHFAASHFKDKDSRSPPMRRPSRPRGPARRTRRHHECAAGRDLRGVPAARLARGRERARGETAARLKPLVARAGAVINGYDIEHSEDITTGEQQATVDALFEE
jgi:hypothetical protein